MLSKLVKESHEYSNVARVNPTPPQFLEEELCECSLCRIDRDEAKSEQSFVQLADGTGQTVSGDYIYVTSNNFRTRFKFFEKTIEEVVKSHIPSNLLKVVSGALLTWIELFLIYDFNPELFPLNSVVASIERFVLIIKNSLEFCTWMKFFKWKNAAFSAYYFKQPLPESIGNLGSAKYLLGGVFYNFTRRLMRDKRVKYEFLNSVNMCKKGMPRPLDDEVLAAERKSFETMTSSLPQPAPIFLNHEIYADCFIEMKYDMQWALGEVRRTAREIFKNCPFSLDQITEPYIASFSANYNNSKGHYGAFGDPDIYFGIAKYPCGKEEGKDNLNRSFFDFGSDFSLAEVNLFDYDNEYFDDREVDYLNERSVIGLEVNDTVFREQFKRYYYNCVKAAYEEDAFVKPVGLKEALKVRVISKGPPKTYFVLKPFQKILWKRLKSYGNLFRYIGEPITEETFNELFPAIKGLKGLSGDYDSATDNLFSEISNACIEEVMDCLEESFGSSLHIFRELMLKAMTGHIYEYNGKFKPQQRGQLMGSIVSFPFLCIINAALVRASYEKAHSKSVPLLSLPATFNGDDVYCTYTSDRFPSIWQQFGNIFGLRNSIGKTYYSSKIAVMNSMLFRKKKGRWIEVKYFHLGLLKGLKRSGNDSKKKKSTLQGPNMFQLSSMETDLLKFCPPNARSMLVDLFIVYNKKTMEKAEGIPWFLPQHLGGLGIQSNERPDLKMAKAIAHRLNVGDKIASYYDDKKLNVYSAVNRKMERASNGLLSSYPYLDSNYDLEGSLVYFFYRLVCTKGLKEVIDLKKSNDMECLRSRQKIVQKARRDIADGYMGEMDENQLAFQSKEALVPVFLSSRNN